MSNPADEVLTRLISRLHLECPLTFLDLETTGLFPETDRVVEIAMATVHPTGRLVRFESLVNPGVPIPATATAVHGLRTDDVREAPTFGALAQRLYCALEGAALAGYNLRRYDLRLLTAEFSRVGIVFDAEAARVIDVMRIFHMNEARDLDAAVRFYLAREHRGHRARPDVDATIAVLDAQLDRYSLPSDVSHLAEYCRYQSADWLTRNGWIAWRDRMPRLTFGRHAGESLRSLAHDQRDYLAWILENDFAPDVKRLIRDALDGRFPDKPLGLRD